MVIRIETYEEEMIIKTKSLNQWAIDKIIKVLDKYGASYVQDKVSISVSNPIYLIIKDFSEFTDIEII